MEIPIEVLNLNRALLVIVIAIPLRTKLGKIRVVIAVGTITYFKSLVKLAQLVRSRIQIIQEFWMPYAV